MKGFKSSWTAAAAASLAVGCFQSQVSPRKTIVTGIYTDAATGDRLSGLTVSILDSSSKGSTVTQDVSGNYKNQFMTDSGVVSFQIDPAATLPLTIIAVASGPGQLQTSNVVKVVAEGVDFSSAVISAAAPPPGVTANQVANAGATDSSGRTQAPIIVSAPAQSSTSSVAMVSIPSNTTALSSSGVPLTGILSVTVGNVDARNGGVMTSIPGRLQGNLSSSSSQPAAGLSDVVFDVAGVVAVTMQDASGNVASKFSQPVTVAIPISASAVNLDTGRPFAVGDTVPAWSYTATTGVWTSDGNGVIALGSNGGLVANVATSQFSTAIVGRANTPCNVPLNVKGNSAQLPLRIISVNENRTAQFTLPDPDQEQASWLGPWTVTAKAIKGDTYTLQASVLNPATGGYEPLALSLPGVNLCAASPMTVTIDTSTNKTVLVTFKRKPPKCEKRERGHVDVHRDGSAKVINQGNTDTLGQVSLAMPVNTTGLVAEVRLGDFKWPAKTFTTGNAPMTVDLHRDRDRDDDDDDHHCKTGATGGGSDGD